MKHFSPRALIRLRMAAGHTQESLAAEVGCHRLSILRAEKGRLPPRAEILAKIAATLKVDVDDLFVEDAAEPDGKCEHGCYGDCWVAKVATWHARIQSSECGVECHSYEAVEERYRRIVARLEIERDEAIAEIYARKEALMFLAAVELTQMTEGWGD